MSAGKKVFAAVSGGVDSGVSAALLIERGFDVSGIFMITHDRAQAAQADAERVCKHLSIPLHVLDLRANFETLIDYFCRTYQSGKTPNPCVFCNRTIKFGLLWEFAQQHGADFIATGHYAQILAKDGDPGLYQARNRDKDQSYALSMIRREVLAHIIFPVGELDKDRTRELAKNLGLPVHDKEDSQEICFIPGNDYIAMLHHWRPDIAAKGKIVDTHGSVLGEHDGIHRYTIGQRRGLGIALGSPAYVVRIDPQTNTVVLGGKEDLMSRRLLAGDFNWLIDPPAGPFDAIVKIRYNHSGAPASVSADPASPDKIEITFAEPVSAITPGQAAVVYIAEGPDLRVAGGGWIEHAIKDGPA